MSLSGEPLFIWLSQFAYEPTMVYMAFVTMMLLSGFGLPLPEEVTILSVALLAHIGIHPDIYPPPYPGAPHVNMHTAMVVGVIAVLGADFMVYSIGRYWGREILNRPFLRRFFSSEAQQKIENWTHKYGAYTCAIFRFTPGIRFPGHLAYGMMKFTAWKFLLIDGLAVLVSVPTQIYLVATYGEEILKNVKEFKIIVFSVIGIFLIYFLIKKRNEKKATQSGQSSH